MFRIYPVVGLYAEKLMKTRRSTCFIYLKQCRNLMSEKEAKITKKICLLHDVFVEVEQKNKSKATEKLTK